MHPIVENLSEQFFLSPAEGLLCGGVHERHPSLGIPQEQRISGIVGYGSGEVELVLQRFLGPFALGNVVLHPDKANEVTLLIAHGGDGEFVPEGRVRSRRGCRPSCSCARSPGTRAPPLWRHAAPLGPADPGLRPAGSGSSCRSPPRWSSR